MALPLSTNIVIVTIVFSIISLISVVLRFVARHKQTAPLRWDDYSILIAVILNLGLGACTVAGVYKGHIGQHVVISPEGVPEYGPWITSFYQVEWAGLLIQIATFAFTKSSLVLFYRRIFRGDRFYLVTAIFLAIICAWGVAFFLAILLECIPISQSFVSPPKRTGRCYNPIPAFDALATTNLALDISILIIPQPYVWKLNVSFKRRVALSLIFLLGAFVIGISAARIYFFYSVAANPKLEYDVTYNSAASFYWTNIDASSEWCMIYIAVESFALRELTTNVENAAVAIVCASLPSMHILLAQISPGRILRSFASMVSLRISSKRSDRSGSPRRRRSTSRQISISSAKGTNNSSPEEIPLAEIPRLPSAGARLNDN
ncbi:hypothetical protein O1611_g2610 [Lasiodiplodia mahajangana]|uniref:Uncharacterized protein n=1 Tax=Lasiodiplodia mahajangana TaxID=1108764 RepID=A0ACC2JU01_9PEZI|nr:hypothetical protein O1611_g2610 [Lasiodiplodia mahajangana]